MSGTETDGSYQLLTMILGTGGVGTFVTWFYDWRAKKRQDAVNIAKFRIEKIDAKYEDYWNLISYSNQLAFCLSKISKLDEFEKPVTLISFLKFMQIFHKLNDKGSFLLSNQDAETILNELSFFILMKIRIILPSFDYVKFRNLESNYSLERISEKISDGSSEYSKYFNQILKWLTEDENKDEVFKIKMTCSCISELLTYELNEVYSIWYNKKFTANEFLSNETKEYLLRTHNFGSEPDNPILLNKHLPNYFTRIS